MIPHICSSSVWEEARTSGMYRAASLEVEGFIHFSRRPQLAGTVARHYADVDGLVVLVVSEALLQDELRIEDGFPHLYGPLPVRAVVDVMPLSDALASVD